MTDSFIPVLLGTARPGRMSEAVAHAMVDLLQRRGTDTDLIDVADYPMSATGVTDGADVDRYRELITAADGLVIVAPEYNHSFPGELKLLLDTDFAAYRHLPVGFVSVSAGMMGGARMVEQLRLVALALGMVPVSPAVHVSKVREAIDDSGGFLQDSLEAVATTMVDELEGLSHLRSAIRTVASLP
jgi:NAD(P)H-dependent FMN reductase